MTPELSRRVGLIMGKASPSPTLDERDKIIVAMQVANTWEALPDDVIEILNRLQNPAIPLLPDEMRAKYTKATGPPKLKSLGGNPNHDKSGKFSSTPGVSKPGTKMPKVTATSEKLTAAHFEAMAPTTVWTDAKRTEILSKLRETSDGQILSDVLDRFQDGGSIAHIRKEMDTRLAGGSLTPEKAKRADVLISSLKNAPSSLSHGKTFYRGMAVPGSVEHVMSKYTEGSHIDLNLTSFTSDRTVAKQFQQRLAGKGKTRVTVQLEGDNKKLLPIQNLARDRRLFKEKEWVGAGKYKVNSVKKSGDGGITIKIEQVGTL